MCDHKHLFLRAMQNFTPTIAPKEKLLPLANREQAPQPAPSKPHDEVSDRVRLAEEQLRALTEKRQMLERQKYELEQLGIQQRKFAEGKAEMVQLLKETIPALEKEAAEAQRCSEFLNQMQQVFGEHLKVLNTMDPDEWNEGDIREEVQRGLAALAEVQEELDNFDQRMSHFGHVGRSSLPGVRTRLPLDQTEFARWMRMGFAFALPLMIFVAITLLVTYLIVSV